MSDRVQELMRRRGIDAKAARRILEEADEERSTYYNFYSLGTWGTADTYDLCINSRFSDPTARRLHRPFREERFGLGEND